MGTKKISRETSKTVQVKEDPVTKELYFDLPPGVLKSLGWKEDDELEWYETQEGNWALRKVRLAEEPKDPAAGPDKAVLTGNCLALSGDISPPFD